MSFGNLLPLIMGGPMDANFEIALMVPTTAIEELVGSADTGVAIVVTAIGVVDRTDRPYPKSQEERVLELDDCVESNRKVDHEEAGKDQPQCDQADGIGKPGKRQWSRSHDEKENKA
jgi:hypothetical protein